MKITEDLNIGHIKNAILYTWRLLYEKNYNIFINTN